MRFDRIFVDMLAWINQLGWYREQKVKKRPYEKLDKWHLTGLGILSRVARPEDLCPRDCGTYIFEPFRYGKNPVRDIHICVDHLEGMAVVGRSNKRIRSTHRITVLAAEHWMGADGRYEADELFSVDDDLQGQSSRRDLHIRCILHQFALGVAAAHDRPDFDYLRELDSSKKVCMKSSYDPSLGVPHATGVVVARSLDGGPSVRIRLDDDSNP